ncbi:hypothetical protein I9018_24400 [Pseudomonas sp. MPFS]|uniref:hypothetical protein n=1 Tax=Pseudomonas sp. MPFS TaxID=2795724 RepID=UPI001F13F3F1|nr:hypothetical protein [Pseudomonas sp. MPFS]UMZ10604.1 hypothetical protein I9018_24400 [Pseudomonas sp. MPFS]
MLKYARWLFGSAALFNALVAASVLFLEQMLRPLLGLEVATGSNLVMRDLAMALVAAFGVAYLCVALDPRRFRPYIVLGVLGKCLVLVCVFGHWLASHIGWQLPTLALGDAIYSLLFLQFLRRYPAWVPMNKETQDE